MIKHIKIGQVWKYAYSDGITLLQIINCNIKTKGAKYIIVYSDNAKIINTSHNISHDGLIRTCTLLKNKTEFLNNF